MDGTTHYAGCWDSGPRHYECALLEITRLRKFILTQMAKEAQEMGLYDIDNPLIKDAGPTPFRGRQTRREE